jgi:hypothetical protein
MASQGTVTFGSAWSSDERRRASKVRPCARPHQVCRSSGSGDGFHWGDALIGALIASGLLLIGLAAARAVVRHRRMIAASRA